MGRGSPSPPSRTRPYVRTRSSGRASMARALSVGHRRPATAGGTDRMSVIPGAEAFTRDGEPVGVLLCHGFTGTPQTMRPWAEYLADAGLTVSVPRLPGHGTTWQNMNRTRSEDWFAEAERSFEELRGKTDEIFLMGLSLGACIALRIAELRGA